MAQGYGGLIMKIIDKNINIPEIWELGDVVTDEINIGLIVKNNDGDYCVMDITPFNENIYSVNSNDYFGLPEPNLKVLCQGFSPTWHKVNAKLVIE